MAGLGYLSELKRGRGTSLWCLFYALFSNKNLPYLILYQWTNFQCHTFFPSQNIEQNVLISSCLVS